MWKVKGQETISERPDEEDCESIEKNYESKLDYNGKPLAKPKPMSKIDRILEIHNSQKKNDFLMNTLSVSKDKTKRKLLEKSNKENLYELDKLKPSSLSEVKIDNRPNEVIGNNKFQEEKKIRNNYQFVSVESNGNQDSEFDEIQIKIEESKGNNKHTTGTGNNLQYRSKIKFAGIEINRDENKTSSINENSNFNEQKYASTNTQKMR
jgi:hypothetical protein